MDRPDPQGLREAGAVLRRLRELGVEVRAEGDSLHLRAPRGALSAELADQIRTAKPALLQYLTFEAPKLERLGGGSRPLGIVQRRMWMMDRLEPGATFNNLPGAWRLSGRMDLDAFHRAFEAIVARHEILRSRIEFDGEEPRQVVDPDVSPKLPETDLTTLDEGDRHEAMMEQIRKERDRPFDLSSAPLFRGRLFRMGPEDQVLFLLPHHVIWDGWSWDVFLSELSELYPAFVDQRPCPLPDLPYQFSDYVAWHRRLMEGPEFDRQLGFWEGVLGGGVPPLEFPSSGPGSGANNREGDRRTVAFDQEMLARLNQVARGENATLFMVLLAAYFAWLHRWSGQEDFAVGVPTQDRLHTVAHDLIGVLVNTLAIRAQPAKDLPFLSLVREVRDRCLEAYDHQDIPFDRLVDELHLRDRDTDPVFQVLFAYQDIRNRPSRIGDLDVTQVHIDTGTVPASLLFGFMVSNDRAVGLLDFSTDLFSPGTMDRMAQSFGSVLGSVAADPERPLRELDFVGGPERVAGGAGSDLFADEEESDADPGLIPLSPYQDGIWFLERTDPGSARHHLVEAFEVSGRLRPKLLEEALRAVVSRHDGLRCSFTDLHGRARMRISEEAVVDFSVEDCEPEAMDRRIAELSTTPFDITRPPLHRVSVLRSGRDECTVCLIVHNLVADEKSVGLLCEEWGYAYEKLVTGQDLTWPDAAVSFAQRARADRQRLNSGEMDEELRWWSQELEPPSRALELPVDRPRPTLPSSAADSVFSVIPSGTWARTQETALRIGIEPEAVIHGALGLMFSRQAEADEIAVGALADLRDPEGRGPQIGPYENTVVVRLSVDPAATVDDFCRRTGEVLSRARARRAYPFAKVVEQIRPDRRAAPNPLFQVLTSMEVGHPPALNLARCDVLRKLVPQPGLDAELGFFLEHRPDGSCLLRADFPVELFDRSTIERTVARLTYLLAEMLEDGSRALLEVPALPPDEQEHLLELGKGESAALNDSSLLPGISRQVEARPDQTAVTGAGEALSYSDLWLESGRVAAALEEAGVGAGDTVGVAFERAPAMLSALLGIWRTGAAYLPLDPEFPEQRLAFMVEDSGAEAILWDGLARIPECDARVLSVRNLPPDPREGAGPEPTPDDLAYVIYTSGSTGRPKGVEVTHGNVLNFVQSMSRGPGMGPDDVVLAVTTLSFDIAVLELWLPLWVGAKVVIAEDDEVRDGEWLAERLAREKVTILQGTPSTWRMLLEGGWETPIRRALCGGEAFPLDLVAPLTERAGEVWNMYGPTETTVWSSTYQVQDSEDGEGVPIGRAIENTRLYVVDPAGRLAAHGVPGELWIGGAGVARAYRNRPDLTSDRFVTDPFTGTGRAYRTGDLARWRSDGVLEHLGRMDTQVKVHGYRIELGEVEAALVEHPGVARAVASVVGRGTEARLVGHVVPSEMGPVLGSELRRALRERLPDYMIPGLITEIDAVPLTPNGKVDRNSLPDPLVESAAPAHRAPRTDEERAIAQVWSRLLAQERVGLDDNFFELGGHSLLAIRAVAVLSEEAGIRLDPRSLFFMTLEQLAASSEAASVTTPAAG